MLRGGSGSNITMKSPLSSTLKLRLARQIQIFKYHQTPLPRPGATHKQHRMNHLLAIAKQAPTLYLNQPPCPRLTNTNGMGQTQGMSSGMMGMVVVWLPPKVRGEVPLRVRWRRVPDTLGGAEQPRGPCRIIGRPVGWEQALRRRLAARALCREDGQ